MKVLYTNYRFFSILFFLIAKNIAGQELNDNICNYQKIDNYITEHHIRNKDNHINILYSSNDCEKCILYLGSVLKELKDKQGVITVNVISDNVVFAKKKLAGYKLPVNYYYDNELFNNFGIDYRTKLYLKTDKGFIISDTEKILNYLHYELSNEGDVILKYPDSIIDPYKMISTILPYDSFLTLDSQMEVALLFKRKSNNSDVFDISKIESTINDSLKLYNLPERIPFDSGLKKVAFSEFDAVSRDNLIPLIKIHSITGSGSSVYCNFAVSRLYRKKEGAEYALLTNSFLGVKKINNEKELLDVMNLDTYDNIYHVDVFDYEGEEYPMSIWITDGINIIDTNIIATKVNKVIPMQDELVFGGLATIELNPVTQTAVMTGLNTDSENAIKRTNILKTKKYNYYIKKEMIDKENNYGILKIIRFSNKATY